MPPENPSTSLTTLKALAIASLVTAAAAAAVIWVAVSQHERHRQSLRTETVERLGRIRANIESTLNGSLTLTQGVAATIHAHGQLTDAEFATIAEQLVGSRRDVRNLGVAYGTVLRQVYPRLGNESAIGLDYRQNPKQWPKVEQTIQSGKTMVDGPLSLVQGGIGVISRTPVMRPSGPGAPAGYFALVSIVIDLSTLLDQTGISAPDVGLNLAIQANGQVFHGDPKLREQHPVELDISFPGGGWRIYAVPASGWPSDWWRQDPVVSTIGLALILAVAATSFYAAFVWRHRTRLYESLRESESRYRHLLDTAPAAIVLHRQGRIIFSNREAVRLMAAHGPEDLLDRPVLDLLHPDYHSVVTDRLAALKAPGDEAPPLRQKLISLDGQVIDADVASSAVMIGGELAVLAIAIDTTRSVRAEAQRQAILDDLQRSNDELRQFTSAASHDLQEPLRQVATYVQMLERRYGPVLDQDGRDFIQYAVDGVIHMRRLLHDLGLYAQVKAAGAPLKRLEIGPILDRVSDAHDDQLRRLGGRIDHDPLPSVMGDEGQIQQLLSNLLDNALRYSRLGVPPRISLSATRQGAFWLFRFRDNGIGIASEYQSSIFDVFTRLHGISQSQGTGFGLAICRRIVERHGGQIWVESEPDQGSTFLFTLPTA